MKKRILLCIAVLGIFVAPITAMAGDTDISKELTCAAVKVFECTADNGCQEVTANAIDMPQMFRFDLKAKTVTGIINGKKRTTKIEYSENIDGKLMLYGAEDGQETSKDGVAWNGVIDEMSGSLVVSASGDNIAFVIFGACIPR